MRLSSEEAAALDLLDHYTSRLYTGLENGDYPRAVTMAVGIQAQGKKLQQLAETAHKHQQIERGAA